MTAVIALVAPNRVAASEWATRHPDLASLCKPVVVNQTPIEELQGLRVCHVIYLRGAGMQPGFMKYKTTLDRLFNVLGPTEALEQLALLFKRGEQ